MITILGATGYTGRLIAKALHEVGAPIVLAGRNEQRLHHLSAQLDGTQIAVTDVRDGATLDNVARSSRVLINCVGPFVDYGEPVVRTAIAAGCHYLDITGEQPFLRAMLIHDTWARERKVAVVSAMAFEVAVADCAVAIAANGFESIDSVEVAYALRFHASKGSQRTMIRMLQSDGYAYERGDWVPEAPARWRKYVHFPEPIGKVAAVSFPSAEVVTIPRHLAVQTVRTYMVTPAFAARALSACAPLIARLIRSPVGTLANRLVGEATTGPDESTRRHDVFHLLVRLHGRASDQTVETRLLVRGRDPYGLTAIIARQAALKMLEPHYDRAGVLPPAVAFDPRSVLDSLRDHHVTYEPVAA